MAVYHDLYSKYDFPWWAAVGFSVSGRNWCMPLRRTKAAGPFTPAEAEVLAALSPHLRRIVSVAEKAVAGRVACALDGLDLFGAAAFAVDWNGRLIRMNGRAEALLGKGILSGGWLR